jgi:hypothetical protein
MTFAITEAPIAKVMGQLVVTGETVSETWDAALDLYQCRPAIAISLLWFPRRLSVKPALVVPIR